jgi:hypothetical protein
MLPANAKTTATFDKVDKSKEKTMIKKKDSPIHPHSRFAFRMFSMLPSIIHEK